MHEEDAEHPGVTLRVVDSLGLHLLWQNLPIIVNETLIQFGIVFGQVVEIVNSEVSVG